MQTSLKVGDVVRRKNDTSGRTRAVKEIYSGGQIVMLDEFLDGWLIWDARKLQLVARAATQSPANARPISVKREAQ